MLTTDARKDSCTMKIYTRKGDSGQTSIWGGRRLSKGNVRMEAIGAVDECNAAIGSALACEFPNDLADAPELRSSRRHHCRRGPACRTRTVWPG
jgi:hypothetical protein